MKRLASGIGAVSMLFAAAGAAVASDSFWERYFGEDNPVCNRINVSGYRYCLPKTRVKLWKTGEHVAMMLFYPKSLSEGEYVRISLLNARVVGHATDGETMPEHYLRGAIEATEHRQNTNGERKRKVDELIDKTPNSQIIDMSDLLGDDLLKSYPYIITNNKRVTHFINCRPPNQFGLRSCQNVSQFAGDKLYVHFFLGGKIKDDAEFLQQLLNVEREFRDILKGSIISNTKDI